MDAESSDKEFTLGTGKLLGLFFLLAAICGVFFSIGYSLGRSSGREQALNDQPSQVNAAAPSDSVLGEVDLDELLAHREKINLRLQSILDQHTDPWGVKVTNVEVKQVDLPETMTRAMAKQAEAEREKRSKIIHAEGEFAAAQRLIDAAHLLATEPTSIQLRYLQTLTEIGVEKNTTIIFPVPVDLLAGLQRLVGLDAAKIASESKAPGQG